ncbi:MAG: transcription initiation factor IIB [Candidatus Nitrosocaldaceae archaeon]|nr:MAG: transcription initiation factor IIB [Candidatus Nitrosocaldaceae archaeon]
MDFQCKECNTNLIEDIDKGEWVCPRCGCVALESITSYAPEFIATDLEDRLKNSRSGAPMSYSMHDLGLSTEIGNINRDYNGNKIDSNVIEQMNNAKRWQSRIRVGSSKERRLSNVLSKINEYCSNLSLPKIVNETAALLYRNYENTNAAKGKMINSMALATIYLACKKSGIVKSLDEIADACNINDSKTLHLASKYYRELLFASDDYNYNNRLDKYIAKIVNKARLDTRVEKVAIELAKNTSSPSLLNGKDPSGLAAAYTYMATVLLGINLHQRDISTFSNVTEVTIRNRCKEIISNYKVKLALKCK